MTAGPFTELDTIGVVAANSTAYVETMLANLASGSVSVPLGSVDDHHRLTCTGTSEVITPTAGAGWLHGPFTSEGGNAPAQISFTSGTEGQPKAVLLSRGNLDDVVRRINAAMEVSSEIREYVGVPVFHSFGYARCRAALHAGGAVYIPEGGFDLAEIRRMLADGQINAISAVPSLWRIFLAGRDRFGAELEAVRWVEIGSQYMSAKEKAALRTALPNARIVQHYGLTEASRTTLQRIHSARVETLGSVGQTEGTVQVRLSPEGRIEICGPHVALGILDGDTWQDLGPEVWLETSDIGRIEDGLLYYEGRADDMINCGGVKLSPDLMETDLRAAVPESGDFGILRRPDPVRGDGIGLVLGPDAAAMRIPLAEALAAHAAGMGVNARGAISVHETGPLPRTATGKLQRAALARHLDTVASVQDTRVARDVEENFSEFLTRLMGGPVIPGKSFGDLGGDSLMHMQITLALERVLGAAPEGWEWLPLDALVGKIDAAGDFETLMAQGGGAPLLPDGSRNLNPPDLSFWSLVAEDYRTNDASIFHQGFLMLLVHRFGNVRMAVRWKLFRAPLTVLYRFLNKATQIFFGMKLDYTVKVGRRVKLEHFGGMILGARAIGDDVVIRQNTTFGIRSTADPNAKPTIGTCVDIGAGAVIVGNITIGENSIIGANTVVFTSIPPDSVVMGVPGRIIGANPRRNPSPLDFRHQGEHP